LKIAIFNTPLHSTPPLGGPRRNAAVLEWCGYLTVKKFDDMFSDFNRIPVCDRQTDGRKDGQTDGHLVLTVRAMYSITR